MSAKYVRKSTTTEEGPVGKEESIETISEEQTVTVPETEVASAAPVVDNKEELVTVKKSDLEEFLARLSSLEEDNKKLLQVADRSRMAAIEEEARQKNQSLPEVKLTRIGGPQGKLVLAWRLVDNESYVDNGRLVEKQTMEVFYEDGSSELMPLVMFYRKQNKETTAQVIGRTQDAENDSESLKVRINATGEEKEIEIKYVN